MSSAPTFAFDPAIEAQLRRQIRTDLSGNVPDHLMDELVDLVFHASNTAINQIDTVLKRGSHPGIYLTGIGIAVSLLRGRCDQMIDALREYAAANNLPTKEQRPRAGPVLQ